MHVSGLVHSVQCTEEEFVAEICKCRVLCANCHRIKTAADRDSSRRRPRPGVLREVRQVRQPGSVVPLYIQIADWVAAEIDAGRLVPGAKFADSRDLADDWHVAYLTVRRAMRELRERGLVESRVGKGTFVTRPS